MAAMQKEIKVLFTLKVFTRWEQQSTCVTSLASLFYPKVLLSCNLLYFFKYCTYSTRLIPKTAVIW